MSLTVPAGAVASSGATSRLSQIASQYSAAKLLTLRPDPAPAPSPAKPQPQPAAASPGSGTASPAAVLQNLPVPQKAPQNAGANGAPAPIRLDSPTAAYISEKLAAGDTRFAEKPELSVVSAQESRTRQQVWSPRPSTIMTVGGQDYEVLGEATATTYEVSTRVVKVEDSSQGILYTYSVRSERLASGAGEFGPPQVTLERAETAPRSTSRAMPSLMPVATGGAQGASGSGKLAESDMVAEGAKLITVQSRQAVNGYGLAWQNPGALLSLSY